MRLWQGVASRSTGGISGNSELAKMTIWARIDTKIQKYLGINNKTDMQGSGGGSGPAESEMPPTLWTSNRTAFYNLKLVSVG